MFVIHLALQNKIQLVAIKMEQEFIGEFIIIITIFLK